MATKSFTPAELPTVDDLREFAQQFHVECWVCRSDEWVIQTFFDRPAVSFRQVATEAGPGALPLHMPTMALICNNCSTIWEVSMESVKEWVEHGKPAKGKVTR